MRASSLKAGSWRRFCTRSKEAKEAGGGGSAQALNEAKEAGGGSAHALTEAKVPGAS